MGRPIVQVSLKDFATRKKAIAAELWTAANRDWLFLLEGSRPNGGIPGSDCGWNLCRIPFYVHAFASRVNSKCFGPYAGRDGAHAELVRAILQAASRAKG